MFISEHFAVKWFSTSARTSVKSSIFYFKAPDVGHSLLMNVWYIKMCYVLILCFLDTFQTKSYINKKQVHASKRTVENFGQDELNYVIAFYLAVALILV